MEESNIESYLKDGVTCAGNKGSCVYLSRLKGVRPILVWVEEKKDLRGFSFADRVVGKASASLIAYVGAESVYGEAMSKTALEYLKNHGVDARYGILVEGIKNHEGTASCPMEEAVKEYDSPADCLKAILAKIKEKNSYSPQPQEEKAAI